MFRFICLAAIVTVALASPAYADDDGPSLDDIPHITMVGTADIEARPDLATITLGVVAEQPSAKAATADVAGHASAVIDAAKRFGVPETDIATQSVSLAQIFDPIKDAHGTVVGQKPRGFEAETVVAIKTHALADTGRLTEALIAAGANRLDGVTFSVENPALIIEKLTGSAVRNARTEANAAAEAAGVRLGRVLLIERPDASERSPRFATKRNVAMAPASIPFEPGTKTYSTSVAVTWAIEPR